MKTLTMPNNGGIFYNNEKTTNQIKLPANVLVKEWAKFTEEEYNKLPMWNRDWIKNKLIKTKVPVVPAQFLPRGKLDNYYILWEVEDWENIPPRKDPIPPRKDPILLKRISNNLFAVLAVWKLTKLEQSIIRGR